MKQITFTMGGERRRYSVNDSCLSTEIDGIRKAIKELWGMKPVEREWKQRAVLQGSFLVGDNHRAVINLGAGWVSIN